MHSEVCKGREAGNVEAAFTVSYSDGTSSTGSTGFPNWSFADPTEFGSQLAITTKGRNPPGGTPTPLTTIGCSTTRFR